MADDEWKALPHQPIEKLSENLWRVVGSVSGMSLKRVMAVARLGDGRLVIHSAVALDEPSMAQLEAWGTPAFLIVPNGYHRLDAPRYKRRYPALRVLTPPRAHKRVAAVVTVDGDFGAFPGDERVRLALLAGTGDREGVMSVRSSDGVTLVLTDAVFNMDVPRDFMGWLVTKLFASAPGPRVSRMAKLWLVKDRAALKAELERLATTPELVRVIVAHDKLASGADAAAALRQAATYL